MKSYKILLFFLLVFALLGGIWTIFPKEGIRVGHLDLRFPSYADAAAPDTIPSIDIDSMLLNTNKSFEMSCTQSQLDSLTYFRTFLTQNPIRIHLPNNDLCFFDTLFTHLEQAEATGTTYRIMHYGDSQIELDRISSTLRQRLQELFGGSGVGMVPAIQKIPSPSISQQSSGNLTRYIIYGDSTTQRASHNQYGVMGHFSQLTGKASITLRVSNHSHAKERVKQFSHVSLLVSNAQNLTATLKCDTFPDITKSIASSTSTQLIEWNYPVGVQKAVLKLEGEAQIDAILLDGEYGVAVDNNALRGCSGTIFSRIDTNNMQASFAMLNTELIILQFGGNRMPAINSTRAITPYMKQIVRQIDYFKKVAPNAKILFIGPSDMGKRIDGEVVTWPYLPQLNDSLLHTALNHGAAYWDMFNAMGGENSMAQWVSHTPAYASTDYIHFTHQGAEIIGTLLTKAFESQYQFFQLKKELPLDSVVNYIQKEPLP